MAIRERAKTTRGREIEGSLYILGAPPGDTSPRGRRFSRVRVYPSEVSACLFCSLSCARKKRTDCYTEAIRTKDVSVEEIENKWFIWLQEWWAPDDMKCFWCTMCSVFTCCSKTQPNSVHGGLLSLKLDCHTHTLAPSHSNVPMLIQ